MNMNWYCIRCLTLGPVDVRAMRVLRRKEDLMETHIIDLADLAELLHGNPVAVAGIWLVLNARQLDRALGVLEQYRDGAFDVLTATAALRAAGLNLDVRGSGDDRGP